jgi:hypothetical protein
MRCSACKRAQSVRRRYRKEQTAERSRGIYLVDRDAVETHRVQKRLVTTDEVRRRTSHHRRMKRGSSSRTSARPSMPRYSEGASKVRPGTDDAPPKKMTARRRCRIVAAAEKTSRAGGQASVLKAWTNGRRSIPRVRRTNGDHATAYPQASGQL